MNHLGITGRRTGLTEKQYTSLRSAMYLWSKLTLDPVLHHGDCVGADEMSYLIGTEFGYKIICHPPIGASLRAFTGIGNHEIREPREYLERNADIASECHVLIGVPDTFFEKLRSGTWATIRYARANNKLIIKIWPDGSVEIE
jgi:hypothetical protein